MDIENVEVETIIDSVSSGDVIPLSSVSGGDAATYIINFYELPETTEETVIYTIWNKPLEEYTVTESLVLILVTVSLIILIWTIVKGGFKWQI